MRTGLCYGFPTDQPTSQPLCSYWSASTFTAHKKRPVFSIIKKQATKFTKKYLYKDLASVGMCI